MTPEVSGISPFFIVKNVPAALAFYPDRSDSVSHFRDHLTIFSSASSNGVGAMIMFKDVGVDPLPNYKREPAARWDAYLFVPDPDALAAEFASRDVPF